MGCKVLGMHDVWYSRGIINQDLFDNFFPIN